MTNTTLPDEVLKTDVRGRVRTPKARREALLDEFERSGLSGQKFAALVGVKYQTFASWAQKRRRNRGGHALVRKAGCKLAHRQPFQLLEAVVESTMERQREGGPLRVELPGGVRLEVGDHRQAALAGELLRVLSGRPC